MTVRKTVLAARKILLAASAAALVSSPAWALTGPALAHPFGPPSTTPNNTNNPGASHRSPAANDAIEDETPNKDNHGSRNSASPGEPGNSDHPSRSHKCKPHGVAYVALGTLESWLLNKNPDGTYTGTVTHTNHHAAGDKNTTPVYKVENVHVTFALLDTNSDGSVGVDDLKAGDRVRLIGKISALAKKCSHSGFEAKTTIRRVVFSSPQPS